MEKMNRSSGGPGVITSAVVAAAVVVAKYAPFVFLGLGIREFIDHRWLRGVVFVGYSAGEGPTVSAALRKLTLSATP
jgi:hypothetical protein